MMPHYKTILVPYAGREDEGAALETAFALARKHAAHVKVVHVLPDPEIFIPSVYPGFDISVGNAASVVKELQHQNKAQRKLAEQHYQEAVRASGIANSESLVMPDKASASLECLTGDAESIIAFKGQMADLLVISHQYQYGGMECEHALMSALFRTGRAVLLVPEGKEAFAPPHSIVIGWNASPQAVRAINHAMPLLSHAANIHVITVTNHSGETLPVAPEEVSFWLALHDIDASAKTVENKEWNAAVVLLEETRKLQRGWLVIGAYSHSRWREMILGGATNFMLAEADLPVLLAH